MRSESSLSFNSSSLHKQNKWSCPWLTSSGFVELRVLSSRRDRRLCLIKSWSRSFYLVKFAFFHFVLIFWKQATKQLQFRPFFHTRRDQWNTPFDSWYPRHPARHPSAPSSLDRFSASLSIASGSGKLTTSSPSSLSPRHPCHLCQDPNSFSRTFLEQLFFVCFDEKEYSDEVDEPYCAREEQFYTWRFLTKNCVEVIIMNNQQFGHKLWSKKVIIVAACNIFIEGCERKDITWQKWFQKRSAQMLFPKIENITPPPFILAPKVRPCSTRWLLKARICQD